MNQTFILQMENNLSVRFSVHGESFEIQWSRGLKKKDLPHLEEYYVPWRDNIIMDWCIRNGRKVDFVDYPMVELVGRKR